MSLEIIVLALREEYDLKRGSNMKEKKMVKGEREDRDRDRDRHSKGRNREEAVWPQFNNALVCHTRTEFVGQISIEGQRGCKKEGGMERGSGRER